MIEIPEFEVHVWWARTLPAPSEATTQRLLQILDAEERTRCARFHFEKDRILYLCAHAMLRVLCTRYCGGAAESHRFEAEANGRPRLAPGCSPRDLDFNLSHTQGLVACGFTRRGRIGVDVESVQRRADWQKLVDRVLSDVEHAELANVPVEARPQRFFEYWTVKEAIAKSWGTGVGTDFRRLEIRFQCGKALFVGGPLGLPRPLLLQVEPVGDHRLAVALTDAHAKGTIATVRAPVARLWQFAESWDGLSLD